MAREEEKLNLGKGGAFEKDRLKRLRHEDETWEADFQALPRPITQSGRISAGNGDATRNEAPRRAPGWSAGR